MTLHELKQLAVDIAKRAEAAAWLARGVHRSRAIRAMWAQATQRALGLPFPPPQLHPSPNSTAEVHQHYAASSSGRPESYHPVSQMSPACQDLVEVLGALPETEHERFNRKVALLLQVDPRDWKKIQADGAAHLREKIASGGGPDIIGHVLSVASGAAALGLDGDLVEQTGGAR